ncbi:unnamed protein product [Acanthoscelides obtectus]|uniref:Uncharacterized protein n=1 Tax=Acanthoscelides obtectus TaxID=200917 RepID=A0A9P0KA64_ACAOB|nr:unnamed protein product [Acanthoscelides obtectus]CAK1633535.1 hypothetical protein AOBTE_LOCUS8205 [Acanthoscelides obtectus]
MFEISVTCTRVVSDVFGVSCCWSPDLTSIDYILWDYVKQEKDTPSTLEFIKERIKKALENTSEHMLEDLCYLSPNFSYASNMLKMFLSSLYSLVLG